MIGLRIINFEKHVRCILGPDTILWYGIDLICGTAGLTNTNLALSSRLPNQTLLRLEDVIPGSRYSQTILLTHKQAESLSDAPIRTFLENVDKRGVKLVDSLLFDKNCIETRGWKGLAFHDAIFDGYNLESIRRCANGLPEIEPQTNESTDAEVEEINMTNECPFDSEMSGGIPPKNNSMTAFIPIINMKTPPQKYYYIGADGHRYLIQPHKTTSITWTDIHPYIATYNGFYYIYSAREE